MAIVTRTRKNGKVVHYVVQRKDGEQVWEPIGGDKREAQRRNTTMRRELADGSYTPRRLGVETVGAFAQEWFRTRTNRTAKDEEAWWHNHIAGRCPWFVALKLDAILTAQTERLAMELKRPYPGPDGAMRVLSPKSHSNIFGVAKTMWGDVMRKHETRIVHNPFKLLKRGTTSTKGKTRVPYTAAEVRALTTSTAVAPDARVFLALAFYTGMREGEICGRRFSDWDRNTHPLGALLIATQYTDRKLKTDNHTHDATREVPVHPELAAILDAWWSEGFELVHCRKPEPDDFIVPARWAHGHNQHVDATPAARRGSTAHTRSSAYKMFRRACAALGIPNRSLHSSRHTFTTLLRRETKRWDIVEKFTHNADGKMVDRYNHFEWDIRCKVLKRFLRSAPPPAPPVASNVVRLPARKAG